MFRFKSLGWVIAPLLCSNVLLSAAPSAAYLENMTPQERQTARQASRQSWQTYRFDTHGFQISMPGQPIQAPTENRHLPTQLYLQKQQTSPQQMEIYGVAIAQFSSHVPTQRLTKRILSACAQEREPGTQVTRTQAIRLQSYPGIEVEARTSNGQMRVSRCFVVGQRLYLLMAMAEPVSDSAQFQPAATPSRERTQTMMQFLDSFQVMDLI